MLNLFQHLLGAPAPLKGKFIMDRNLGARDTKRSLDAKGILTYQYGRKDPFAGGLSSTITTAYIGRGESLWDVELSIGPIASSVATNAPLFFCKSTTNWCDGVDSESYIWNDFEQDISDNGKSIFDPCPLGWKVSHWETYIGFETNMTDWDSETETKGRRYPDGDNPFAYYPSSGTRNEVSGGIGNFDTIALFWNATPTSVTQSSRLYISTGSTILVAGGSTNRGSGRQVRCVQHNE